MLKFEKFDGTKTYMFPNGELATPAKIREKFPAVDTFAHIIEVNGDVCQAVMNLNAIREIHGIDSALNEADAIEAIKVKANTPPPKVISPEERLAAAAEFANLLALPDVAEAVTTPGDDTIIKKNIEAGLWSKPMVAVAMAKGVITEKQVTDIHAIVDAKMAVSIAEPIEMIKP